MLGNSVRLFYQAFNYGVMGCLENRAVWQARGSVVSSFPGNCSALLVYTANMVRPGYVTFTYQYSTSDVTFHFKVSFTQLISRYKSKTEVQNKLVCMD